MRASLNGLMQPRLQKPQQHTSLRGAHTAPHSLSFAPVTVADLPLIRRYVEYNTFRTCDYTIGGILMWVGYFNYEYCIVADTLFIKGISESHPGMVAFSLPLGALPLEEAVAMIRDYCSANKLPLAFSAIPASCADRLAEITEGVIEPLVGWSDYLYRAEALAALTGKPYSKKRNHVNRFFADNPSARLEMITTANITEAKAFVAGLGMSEKVDPVAAEYERRQCLDVMDHIGDYLFEGALLRTGDGSVCAVTFGEVIADTLFVHIEKMDHLVPGAGETVNKLFAAEMLRRHCGLRYINREEDMGDPGLRYAKESYHPCMLLPKCNVIVA